jgi:PilZ domain
VTGLNLASAPAKTKRGVAGRLDTIERENLAEQALALCNWTGCERPSGAMLAERPLCLEHFLLFSDRRIATIQEMFTGGFDEHNFSPEIQSFLTQVISQTAILATQTRLLAPSHRDDLIRLSTVATNIYSRIHRAPRHARRVRCLLRNGMVCCEVSERCFTVNISRRGACVEIRQLLRVGQTITLEREDTKECASATVAWTKQSSAQRILTGLQILDKEDFWGLGPSEKTIECDTNEAIK